jgi:twinkle protein
MVARSKIESIPFPAILEGVNQKTNGFRFGEITFLVSGTSIGKSTIVREIVLDLVQNYDYRIGMVPLEESPEEVASVLAGMAIQRNRAHEPLSLDELKVGYDSVFGADKILMLDNNWSATEISIIDSIRYMCLVGAKVIVVDHITLFAAELTDGHNANEVQDKLMAELLRITNEFQVWMVIIAHLRKTQSMQKSFEEGAMPNLDSIKGSGALKQIAYTVIAFSRNSIAEDEEERSLTKFRVLKCRFTGLTGDAGAATYNFETGRMVKANDDFMDES